MPSRHEVTRYLVRIRGTVAREQIVRLEQGVELEDGKTAPARVAMTKQSDNNTWISITIHEGRYRQVRRMCEAVSLSVVRLRRVRYGSLELGELKQGQYRHLTPVEVNALAEGKKTGQRAQSAGRVPSPRPRKT